LAKQEKLTSNILANQAKIMTLQNSLPQEEIYEQIRVGIAVAKLDGRVRKRNKE
jgi:hypothetical protein